MRRARLQGQAAVNRAVVDLLDKFEYPDLDTIPAPGGFGGGGGMAHVLIVSDSEPPSVQRKADYVVPSSESSAILQGIFDTIANIDGTGLWTIWMAGEFELTSDVSIPPGAWIRGLGYTGAGAPT